MAVFNLEESKRNEFLESTAAQRYAEKKYVRDAAKQIKDDFKKSSNAKLAYQQKRFEDAAKGGNSDEYTKNLINKNHDKFDMPHVTDREAKELNYLNNAYGKKILGMANAEAKKRGMKMKGIKEACEYILSILDDEE